MESTSPPPGPLDRESGSAWVQAPAMPPLSLDITIKIPAPKVARPQVRRPTWFASPLSRPQPASQLGAGLVDVPPVAGVDPVDAILVDPVLPEHRRFCGNCGSPVGRSRDGHPGRTQGLCAQCGTPFSFEPRLRRGDVLGHRYEVLGALAYGGVGWIYLGQDLDAGDRWVVLKGLLGPADADTAAAAEVEARVLTEVDHPNIVRVYDVVEEPGPHDVPIRYLVMEYVAGLTLRQLTQRQRDGYGVRQPLPVTQVIAYGLEILSALGYLHRKGLLYCDLKPENVIQSGERIKLIDFGAVRRIDDLDGPIWATVGYMAPEVSTQGMSVAADLYTVGRTLAVLSFDFTGYTSGFRETLPTRADVPLLRQYESYDRFLRRATHPDPAARFGSAEEMAEQLLGVLREVVAEETGIPRPAESTVFFTATAGFGEVVTHHGELIPLRPTAEEVAAALPEPRGELPVWTRGRDALADGRVAEARAAFDEVYAALPGELAPQLALAAAAEFDDDPMAAAEHYARVWRTDHGRFDAACGLARADLVLGDAERAQVVLRAATGAAPSGDPSGPPRRRRAPWRSFVSGLADALLPVPRLRPPPGPAWQRIEARLHEVYDRLGPPVPAGKDPTL